MFHKSRDCSLCEWGFFFCHCATYNTVFETYIAPFYIC